MALIFQPVKAPVSMSESELTATAIKNRLCPHAPAGGAANMPREDIGLPQSLQPRFHFSKWPPTRRRGAEALIRSALFSLDAPQISQPRFRFPKWRPTRRRGAEALPHGVSGPALFSLGTPQSLQPRFRFPEWPLTHRRGAEALPHGVQAPPCFPPDYFREKPSPAGRARAAA